MNNIFRIRRTVCELLVARGYLMPSSEAAGLTLEAFKSRFDPDGSGAINRDHLTILSAKKDNPGEQIFVFWSEDEKLGVKPIKSYVERMQKERIHRAILILQKGITPFARRIIAELAHGGSPDKCRVIELFEETELLVNITQHCFVPQHILLSQQEKQALLTKYKLKDVQLPRIQAIDPIARFYGSSRQFSRLDAMSHNIGSHRCFAWYRFAAVNVS